MAFVLWVTLLLGIFNILKAVESIFAINFVQKSFVFPLICIFNVFITLFVFYKIYKLRSRKILEFRNLQENNT
jgi:hypothetical protein